MNFVTGIAAIAALAIASTGFAESPRAAEQVVALADPGAARLASTDVSLERYAGMYTSKDGEAFVITNDGDHLTLEAPETWGLGSLSLSPHDAESFVSSDGAVRVEFARDARGSVVGAALFRGDSPTVRTERSQSRGIVTIEDPASSTLAFPHVIVTIYDLPTTPNSVGPVAAAH
jgi:hypothetical protein